MIERVEPRPEKKHHSSRHDDRRGRSPSSIRAYSPPRRTQRSPSPRRSRHRHSPSPSTARGRSPSPAAKPSTPEQDDQWAKDIQQSRKYDENRAAACGFDPALTKQKLDEKYGFATDYLQPRTSSPSFGMGRNGYERQVDEWEAWYLPQGYHPPPPGASFKDRLDELMDFVQNGRSACGPRVSMSNAYIGMSRGGGSPSGYQQYAHGLSTGNPYASGMGSGPSAAGTPQFGRLLDDIFNDIKTGRDHHVRLRDLGFSTETIDVIDRKVSNFRAKAAMGLL
jgi:hypothetical protein